MNNKKDKWMIRILQILLAAIFLYALRSSSTPLHSILASCGIASVLFTVWKNEA